MVADRIAASGAPSHVPRAEKRIAVLMPDYPGAAGRASYAVGLDVPQSIVALLEDLADAGYAVSDAPQEAARAARRQSGAGAMMRRYPCRTTSGSSASCPPRSPSASKRHGAIRPTIPIAVTALSASAPRGSAMFWSRFRLIAGRTSDRRAAYHDPALPPRHALLAFALWLRHGFKADALVHMGAHGTLEWLPGKAVALTAACFPEAVTGALPVIYPFLVSNPGEAAQAKRRIAGVTIGHLPPPLVEAGLSGAAQELERLVDEYAIADGLDRRRRDAAGAAHHRERRKRSGLASEAGVACELHPDEALRKIDAWLCDLKDLAIKDGLHVYGRAGADSDDPAWAASAGRRARGSDRGTRWQARKARGLPARRNAAAATCCPPGAISSPPTRACCRRRPLAISAGSAPTR